MPKVLPIGIKARSVGGCYPSST